MNYTKIPVLLYHSINNDIDNNQINIIEFEKQIKYLKDKNYKSIDFKQINPDKKNQVIVTFDDGYKDIILDVLPILKKYNIKAICFIVTNYIGKYNVWDSNKANYKKKELLNYSDIFEWINNGMLIGSHTHNHFDLTKLNNDELRKEILTSKNILEDKFATHISDFCYPFGKINSNAYFHVKNFYNNAYTTNRSRYIHNKHDPFLIPRIDMGKKLNSFKMYLKLKTFYEDMKFKQYEF